MSQPIDEVRAYTAMLEMQRDQWIAYAKSLEAQREQLWEQLDEYDHMYLGAEACEQADREASEWAEQKVKEYYEGKDLES